MPGSACALFSVAGYRTARNRPQTDVTADGQRFLMIRETTVSQVVHVERWFVELLAKSRQSFYSSAAYARM